MPSRAAPPGTAAVILLDAYALTALLADEPAASEVEQLLSRAGAAIAAPNLAEAADRLARVHGIAVERTRDAVESLEQALELRIRPAERGHAWRAAELRAKHYHRTHAPLSLGDCLLLAMTGDHDQLATADPHVLATADAEGIKRVVLADSRGRRYASAG